MNAKAEVLFEVSWEVCNKVGGIHTVVTSKIEPIRRYYKDYYTIGPYFPGRTKEEEFKEKSPPDFFKTIFDRLRSQDIICYYGRWMTEGEPDTILVDYTKFQYRVNEIKAKYWEDYKIDSLNTQYHDYDEPILWSTAVGMLLEEIKKSLPNKKIVAQFHEWMSGGGILYLKQKNVKIGTVFTTHATMLGRTLAGNHVDLYGMLNTLNPVENAYKYGIQAKFFTERACAQNADVFTTVSEITGIEATRFLEKKPHYLLPNGLDIDRFPTFDEASIKHKHLKAKIKKFLMFYFFPYYRFDIENTLFFFLAGRYEFHDKGIDVFIKALSRLNHELKKSDPEKTVVAFIWVPASVKEIKHEILESRSTFEDIQDSIKDIGDEIINKIIYALVGQKKIDEKFILGESLIKQTEKKLARFFKKGIPPLCTHALENEGSDEILRCFKENGLGNTEQDRVKVIFYPIYLTGSDQLLDLTYYEGIMASHLGVFPSYYEPWGYTPAETGALGVASVTTDLAGFGRYVQSLQDGKKNPGIYVLKRLNKQEDEIVEGLYKIFREFCFLTKQDRIENKLKAKKLADVADWNKLVENYIMAHNLAADRNS